MTDLDDRLKEYYRGVTLSQESLGALAETMNDFREPEVPAQSHSAAADTTSGLWHRLPFGWHQMQWVAGFLLLVVSSVFMYSTATHHERTERTLREVAMNHATRLDLEFYDSSVASIDQQMVQLPFTLALPRGMDDNYELLGSRYCSLAGNLAAHVKLKNKITGKSASLFVTSLSDELKPVDAAQADLDGLDVELFQEGGLFYAFAHQS